MRPRRRLGQLRSSFLFRPFVIVVLATIPALFSCAPDSTQLMAPVEPQFAPGGGPPVRVEATDPAGAEQGTTLDVRVFGSNFEQGSVATFVLDGVPPGKVKTNSTSFISSGELVANITVDSDADLGLYDVEVITPRGKKGVGTELFEVQVVGGGPPGFPATSLMVEFRDAAGDAIESDGSGLYSDNVDGVRAFVYLGQDFEGQIHLNTDWDDGDPAFRTLQFDLAGAGSAEAVFNGSVVARFSINGDELDAFNALTAGQSLSYRAHFQFEDATATYDLRFGSECGGQGERPTERLLITLVQESPGIWHFSHAGNALLCVVPKKGRGKPAPSYSTVVAVPFAMIVTQQSF